MTPETPSGPKGPETIEDVDTELQRAQEQLAEKNGQLVRLLAGDKLLSILRRMWYHDASNKVARDHMIMEEPIADVILAICETVRKSGKADLFNELSGIIAEESRAGREPKEKVAPVEEIDPA